MWKVKLTRSARRRKIGHARVIEAIKNAGDPLVIPATEDFDERLLWVGADDRGLELEIIGIEQPDLGRLLIIHVMPTAWRHR